MPWDGTELWVADLDADGTLGEPRLVAGGAGRVDLPARVGARTARCTSSRTAPAGGTSTAGGDGEVEPLAPMEAEFGVPQWVFGMSTYAFLADGRIACAVSDGGVEAGSLLDRGRPLPAGSNCRTPLGRPCAADGGRSSSSARTPTEAAARSSRSTLDDRRATRSSRRSDARPRPRLRLGAARDRVPDRGRRSPRTPSTTRRRTPDFEGPAGERRRCIVMSHGGPTAQTDARRSTSGSSSGPAAGFGVVDVNYGGSTGYGRAYRELLDGRVGRGRLAGLHRRRALSGRARRGRRRRGWRSRGGSAGGYTTLCALAFRDVFAAGVSYFGVADLRGARHDTHKFESRYLDGLIGPYPERAELYVARSPIHFVDRARVPADPAAGPRGQGRAAEPGRADGRGARARRASRTPISRSRASGTASARRRTSSASLEATLSFVGQVFGFAAADALESLAIAHL